VRDCVSGAGLTEADEPPISGGPPSGGLSTGQRFSVAADVFGDRVSRVAGFLPEFTWQAQELEDGWRVDLSGRITIEEAPALWKRVSELLEEIGTQQRVQLELTRVEIIDGACMALLVHLRSELKRRRIDCEFTGGSPAVRRIVDLYGGRRRPKARRRHRAVNAVEQVGNATVHLFEEVRAGLSFFGELVISAWYSIKHPRSINVRDITLTMERAGADAAPIVLLINFLIGFVMAYQSALQLKQFGANIFVADLVGLSMTRELGPLMTAIIVCGRTGAAFAAEIGTMKVSEEVDALRTLGFMPLRYLVMPRILGLLLVAPILTLMADAIGILGGLVVGALTLDITPTAYWVQTVKVVGTWDVFSGVLKSMVFAGAIGMIACQQGLATSGGAEGVGRRTTSAVVSILFTLILLDAVFTVLFGALGL
jgi:phospholipid/cholesterol/gamma-HCH transport system permease protein